MQNWVGNDASCYLSSALHAIHGLEITVTISLTTLGTSTDAFGKTLPTTVRFKLNSLAERSGVFSVLKSADTAEYSLVAHTLIWWREYLSLRVLLFIAILYMSLALHSVITPMIFRGSVVPMSIWGIDIVTLSPTCTGSKIRVQLA